jgi:hypothetical protein
MLAGHSPFSSSPETLLLTYLAKKRSEIAPGVGKGTDMFIIGPAAPLVPFKHQQILSIGGRSHNLLSKVRRFILLIRKQPIITSGFIGQ